MTKKEIQYFVYWLANDIKEARRIQDEIAERVGLGLRIGILEPKIRRRLKSE